MTSPVRIYIENSFSSMTFVKHSKSIKHNLLRPNYFLIKIIIHEQQFVAAIKFDGHANNGKLRNVLQFSKLHKNKKG